MAWILFLLLFLSGLLGHNSPTQAIDYYFADGGTNPANCGGANPCPDTTPCDIDNFELISKCLGEANPDVFLKCGDTLSGYDFNDRDYAIEIRSSGSAANKITIGRWGTCTGNNDPIIATGSKGRGIKCDRKNHIHLSNLRLNGSFVNSVKFEGCQNIEFDNVNADHGGMSVDATEAFGQASYKINESDSGGTDVPAKFITIKNCEVSGGQEGFYLGSNTNQANSGGADGKDFTSDILIENCYIHAVGREPIELKPNTSNITIRRNMIELARPGGDNHKSIHCSNSTNCVAEFNWVRDAQGDTTGQGWGIGYEGNATGTAQYNIFENNHAYGVSLEGNGAKTIKNNTIWSNDTRCINDTGTNETLTDNICWANGAGNDATDPSFINAAGNNWNLSSSSNRIGAAAGGADAAAMQAPKYLNGATVDSNTWELTFSTLFPPLQVAAGCTGITPREDGNTCSASNCTVVSDTKIRFDVAGTGDCTALDSADVLSVNVNQAAVTDSINIGGTRAPDGPRQSEFAGATGLSVTNSLGGGGTNLLATATEHTSTGTFEANQDCTQLIDGSAASGANSLLAIGQAPVSCEYDLGSSQAIGDATFTGDGAGACACSTYGIATKVNVGDAYVNAFTAEACNGSQEFVDAVNATGRYVKVTITGPVITPGSTSCAVNGGTQAFEVALSPGTVTEEGPLVQTHFRFRQAEVAGETWTFRSQFPNGLEDAAIVLSPTARFQLRAKYGCPGGTACGSAAFALYTRTCTGTLAAPTCDDEAWAPVTTSLGSNKAALVNDTTVTHGTSTTEQLTAATSFVAGQYLSTSGTTVARSWTAGQEQEAVWLLEIASTAVIGTDIVQFKVFQSDGTAINGTPAQVQVGMAWAQR